MSSCLALTSLKKQTNYFFSMSLSLRTSDQQALLRINSLVTTGCTGPLVALELSSKCFSTLITIIYSRFDVRLLFACCLLRDWKTASRN